MIAGMAKKKTLTAAERAADARMLALLQTATSRPKAWHKLRDDDAHAAQLLKQRGMLELWPETGMYRLKPST